MSLHKRCRTSCVDKLEGMLTNRKYSCAYLTMLITMAGFPVTDRTLKEYLAMARKDAKGGNTDYKELKEHIMNRPEKRRAKTSQTMRQFLFSVMMLETHRMSLMILLFPAIKSRPLP